MESLVIQDAIDLIDRHFDSLEAFGSAHKLVSSWDRDKLNEEKQLSKLELAFPTQLKNAISTAHQNRTSLDEIENRLHRASRDINTALSMHNPLISALETSSHRLHFLQNAGYVVDLVSTVESLSDTIKNICSKLATMADERNTTKLVVEEICARIREIHEPWQKLTHIDGFLRSLPCTNVKAHVSSRLTYLRGILVQFARECYERVYTKVLDWPKPLAASSLSNAPSTRFGEFRPLFQTLLDLQTRVVDAETFSSPDSMLDASKAPLKIWALDWLLDRIRLTFRFSFRGKQATNRIDKPDWHCAFVLQTLRDHAAFLQALTELLSSEPMSLPFDAEIYFAEGLIREVRDKVFADITLIIDQKSPLEAEALFWLTLNETIEFDKSLRRLLSLPADEISGAVGVFSENPKFLQRWIALEMKNSQEHLKESLRSVNAWSRCLTAIPLAEDAQRTPKNFHDLSLILSTAIDRSKEIKSRKDRLFFIEEVVIRLLSDYVSDLHLYEGEDYKDISTKSQMVGICAVHNAAFTCSLMLSQWLDDEFWLDLQEQQNQNQASQTKKSIASPPLLTEFVDSCRRVQKRIVQRIVDQTWRQVSSTLKLFAKKKLMLPPPSQEIPIEPSSELEEPLLLLRQLLSIISNNLAIKSFERIVPKIADLMAEFVFHQIILKAQINKDGAAQLAIDVKHIISIFASFGPAASVNAFKATSEAISLLGKSDADLKEISTKVDKLIRNHQMSDSERAVALSKLCNIHHLTTKQVLYVCNK